MPLRTWLSTDREPGDHDPSRVSALERPPGTPTVARGDESPMNPDEAGDPLNRHNLTRRSFESLLKRAGLNSSVLGKNDYLQLIR